MFSFKFEIEIYFKNSPNHHQQKTKYRLVQFGFLKLNSTSSVVLDFGQTISKKNLDNGNDIAEQLQAMMIMSNVSCRVFIVLLQFGEFNSIIRWVINSIFFCLANF